MEVFFMARKYDLNFKKTVFDLIINHGHSTLKTAQEFNIPLKTLEKWITAYNKDNNVFNVDDFSPQAEINRLNQKIKEQEKIIQLLKKTISFLGNDNHP